jgi:hypothetical protein
LRVKGIASDKPLAGKRLRLNWYTLPKQLHQTTARLAPGEQHFGGLFASIAK